MVQSCPVTSLLLGLGVLAVPVGACAARVPSHLSALGPGGIGCPCGGLCS